MQITWHRRTDDPTGTDRRFEMTRFTQMFDTVASLVAAVAIGTMFVAAAVGPAALPFA